MKCQKPVSTETGQLQEKTAGWLLGTATTAQHHYRRTVSIKPTTPQHPHI